MTETFIPEIRETHAGKDTAILVSEHFGPTFQGEGPSIGRPCYFIRLGGCNLHCVWCDTPYTWRWSASLPHDRDDVYDPRRELTRYTTEALMDIVKGQPTDMIVLTGGEPLLQAPRLEALVSGIINAGYRLEVETNGTLYPKWIDPLDQLYDAVHYNVSPKLNNSGNTTEKRNVPRAMRWFVGNPNAVFKFVAMNEVDIVEIEKLQDFYAIESNRIYVMPEGRSNAQIQSHLEALAQFVLRKKWNLTTRLQVVLYGDRRGV